LNITASSSSKFALYLSTLNPTTSAAGNAAKFDPTRPYTWKIVEAETAITGFDPAAFNIVYDGVGLFANPLFGGTFSVSIQSGGTPKELYLNFTPPAQNSLSDATVDSLLNYMLSISNDVDVLYLTADKYTITPQEPVTIRLNVAKLQQPIFGAQAYLRFSSAYFITADTGAGIPVVAPGGGVWDNVIFKKWNVGGDLDTVLGLSFTAPLGTTADATIAFITLTPNRNATGTSRVIFRGDAESFTGGVSGGTVFTISGGTLVRPARVQTKDIKIPTDETAPEIKSIAVTQSQYGVPVNVKNGPGTDPVSYRAVRGTVVIVVNAKDLPGVGLAGAPTVVLTPPSGAAVTLESKTSGSNDGDFRYEWGITGDTVNGRWNALVTASDRLTPARTDQDSFYITVNTRQVTGVVQLDTFRGTSRSVTFTAGNGTGDNPLKTWQQTVATTDTKFLDAGEYTDLPALTTEFLSPSSPTSTYLRYGTVANLASLVNRVLFGADNFAAYTRDLWFGYFVASAPSSGYAPDPRTFHGNVALALKSPTRSVDAYVQGRLSQGTLNLLAAYPTDPTKVTADQLAALETSLLNDFNTIVLGPNIWDRVRFHPSSVTPPVLNNSEIAGYVARIEDTNPDNNLSAQEVMRLNRLLLNGAYLPYKYGQLNPVTAHGMLVYAGGADSTLSYNIMRDLDTLSYTSSMWQDGVTPDEVSLYTETRFLGIPLRKATSEAVLAILGGTVPTAAQAIQLNRALLEDAFAASVGALNFSSGPIAADTLIALQTFNGDKSSANKATLEPLLKRDFNRVLDSGVLMRAELEAAYPTQIAKYTWRGTYTLIDVPEETTMVAAKTDWNLRTKLGVGASSGWVAQFVNGGKVDTNKYLKAGDINGDNTVNLSDFTIFQPRYLSADPVADLNGDGVVNIFDNSLLQVNFNTSGDSAVNKTP